MHSKRLHSGELFKIKYVPLSGFLLFTFIGYRQSCLPEYNYTKQLEKERKGRSLENNSIMGKSGDQFPEHRSIPYTTGLQTFLQRLELCDQVHLAFAHVYNIQSSQQ